MSETPLLSLYCLLIVAASIAGGSLPLIVRLTHERMNLITSFVAGFLLGMSLWHMLPHAVADTGSMELALLWMMIGLLTTLFLTRTLCVHQHGPVHAPRTLDDHHACDHDHAHESPEPHRHSWVGLAVGMSLHTIIDGVAVAAGVQAVSHQEVGDTGLVGVGPFLAVLLHKPLDALTITSLMTLGGCSRRTLIWVNIGFALIVPVAAAGFSLGVGTFFDHQGQVISCTLAFAAGVFLCIALSDLIPELHFHPKDRLKLASALLIGILTAYGVGFVESGHGLGHDGHPHRELSEPQGSQHDH